MTSDQARQILADASRPLLVTRDFVPILREEVSAAAPLSSAGKQLIAVLSAAQTDLPASATAFSQVLGDGLSLAGYEIRPAQDGSADLAVRLYWRADGAISHDWSVSVRPLAGGDPIDAPGGGIVQVDAANPVHGAYPTSRWSAGEVVADDYWLTLPQGVVR